MRLFTRTSSKKVRRAVLFMWLLIGLTLAVFCSSQVFAAPESDDFTDTIEHRQNGGRTK